MPLVWHYCASDESVDSVYKLDKSLTAPSLVWHFFPYLVPELVLLSSNFKTSKPEKFIYVLLPH